MHTVRWLVPVVVAAAAAMAGCGYAGEPKPPALRRPEKVTDLAAAERGSKIVVTFTLPQETTEGLPIWEFPDVELRIGVQPSTWNQQVWETSSERVPVPAGAWPEKPSAARKIKPAALSKSSAKENAGSKAAQRASKQAKASTKAASQAALLRTIDVDAAKYAGETVVIGVRVHGPGGRDAGWSLMAPLVVSPVLPVPRDVKPSDARNAVHLQWIADAPGFSIFRKPAGGSEGDAEWVHIGDSTQASFDDQGIEYGKTWQYYVESVRHVGETKQVSDPSETITFTPKDFFPPAVPTGLAIIPGARTIELVWDRVADSDLAGYRVYRNGQRIADGLAAPAYSDPNVVAGTRYSYQVSAVDQAGNESEKCAAMEAGME